MLLSACIGRLFFKRLFWASKKEQLEIHCSISKKFMNSPFNFGRVHRLWLVGENNMYRRYGHEISEMFGRQITPSNPSYQNPLPSFFMPTVDPLKNSLRAVEGGEGEGCSRVYLFPSVQNIYSPNTVSKQRGWKRIEPKSKK